MSLLLKFLGIFLLFLAINILLPYFSDEHPLLRFLFELFLAAGIGGIQGSLSYELKNRYKKL